MLHEANHVPGRVTRTLACLANHVYLPQGVHLSRLGQQRQSPLGFPLRQSFSQKADCGQKQVARLALGLPQRGAVCVVCGGSQGARCLNEWASTAAQTLLSRGISILCLTGMQAPPEGFESPEAAPSESGSKTQTWATSEAEASEACGACLRYLPFTDDMPRVLAAADLLVCRAGAGTIAEAAAMGVPMLLVPYPHAADDHQQANARAAEHRGWAVAVLNQEQVAHGLTALVAGLLPAAQRLLDARKALSEYRGQSATPPAQALAQAAINCRKHNSSPPKEPLKKGAA